MRNYIQSFKAVFRLLSVVLMIQVATTHTGFTQDSEFEDDDQVVELSEQDESALTEDELAQILAEEGLVVDAVEAPAPEAPAPEAPAPDADEVITSQFSPPWLAGHLHV